MLQIIEVSDEEALLKWERLFEHVGWGVILFGPSGLTMRSVNPAYARMHGYTVEELKGRPMADTVAPEARPDIERIQERADEEGHHIMDSVHLRKDRSTFPALVDCTAVKGDAGNVLLRWANCQDATAQKRVEEGFV